MKKELMPDIPEMPDSLIDRIIGKKVILFVGAGISALCKYPLWGELADYIIEDFRKRGLIDYQFEHSLKTGNYLPIQKITILSEYLTNGQDLVNDKICEFLTYDKDHCNLQMASKVAKYLFAFKSSIVTTNADLVLDENDSSNEYEKYSSTEKVPEEGINRMSILHLHGSIKDRGNLIFTERQYAENYSQYKKLGKVLTQLIKSNNTIIFVGYSMSEFELLKYFIDSSGDKIKDRLCKLDAYFHTEEDTRLKLDEAYFKALGVKLFPYFIDKKGYEALLDVLDAWIAKINNQVSPSGLTHLDIAKAIAKKPSKTTKQLILRNIAHVDPVFIQEKVITSKYYKEWIKALWLITPLFDPEPYFSTSPSVDSVTRTFWSGLLILRSYIGKGDKDKVIESKLLAMMKKAGRLIRKNKSSRATHKNIDSISILLSEIVMNREELIGDKTIFEPVASLYIEENQYGAYMLAEDIIEKRENLTKMISSERLFEIISFVATIENKDREHYEILSSDKVNDFILTNPKLYYEQALSHLKKTEWLYSNVGSFLHFPSEKNNFMYEQRMYAAWLLFVAPYIDKSLIENDINSLLKSKKEIMNKIGLCLIGIRFNDFSKMFLDKIDVFFSHYQYATDLIQLLKNNSNSIKDDKDLKNKLRVCLDEYNFGCKEEAYAYIIKKAVSNVLADIYTDGFRKYDLTETEKEIIFHLDSSASFYDVDTNKEVNTIYEKIKDKNVDEMISYARELINGRSFFFETSLRKAIDMYLEKKDYSSYKDKIREIGDSYLLSYICNTDSVQINNDGSQRFLYLYAQLADNKKEEAMASILFTCQKMITSDEVDNNYKEQIIKAIDYKLIETENSGGKEIKIGTVINTPLHLYWSVLYDYIKVDEKTASAILLESVHYYYSIYKDSALFKAVMASWFAFIYFYEEENTKEEYFDYVFNKEDCHTAYRIFSYISGTNYYLIKLCELESFNTFVSNKDDNSQERVTLASRVILIYLFENKLEDSFKTIINNGDIEAVERSMYPIVKNIDKFIGGECEERFNEFIDGCITSLKSIKGRAYSFNQILRFLVDIMVEKKDQNLNKLWDLIILLPKGLTYYHDNSIAELLTTFGKANTNECIKLLDSLFESYDSIYIIDSYLIDLFTLLKKESVFKNELKRWLAKIGEKNPAIYERLSAIVVDKE